MDRFFQSPTVLHRTCPRRTKYSGNRTPASSHPAYTLHHKKKKKKKSGRTKCLFKRCRPLKHNHEAAFSRRPKIVRTTRRFLCAQILKNIVYNPSCQQRPYHTILCNNFWFCTRLHHQSQHTYDQRPKNIFMKTGQGTP